MKQIRYSDTALVIAVSPSIQKIPNFNSLELTFKGGKDMFKVSQNLVVWFL